MAIAKSASSGASVGTLAAAHARARRGVVGTVVDMAVGMVAIAAHAIRRRFSAAKPSPRSPIGHRLMAEPDMVAGTVADMALRIAAGLIHRGPGRFGGRIAELVAVPAVVRGAGTSVGPAAGIAGTDRTVI